VIYIILAINAKAKLSNMKLPRGANLIGSHSAIMPMSFPLKFKYPPRPESENRFSNMLFDKASEKKTLPSSAQKFCAAEGILSKLIIKEVITKMK
jgi:hypothetical protein